MTMNPLLTTDSQGVPVVQILSEHLWDLVEYLSAQRFSVHYSYHGDHFEVRFPRMTVANVEQALDEWANANAQLAA
jgi:hypothetical protein